ncbi:hypothetical protein H9Y04_27425 [Streptomyces sp. TRM66268-LWL]|uniref:Uncharacterized protein n=1 Tax=Streptomyces polyasparticus TaxID=2767826 RepID=A0ABR7SPK0_9ACTN|nr:hypothetical protein [Streptomyces polyasparticus]MBC9716273.1 hypothetical protein [Streptomyces polyasparticus]
MRTITRGLAIAGAVTALGFGATGTASAETSAGAPARGSIPAPNATAPDSGAGVLAAPPSCVRSWTTTNYAYAKSSCSGSYTIKFVWSYGRDSFTIRPGEQWHHARPSSISGFDGLQLC